MGKKVLIIGTSPRIHGNSNILARSFAKGAKKREMKWNLCLWQENGSVSVSAAGAACGRLWNARSALWRAGWRAWS